MLQRYCGRGIVGLLEVAIPQDAARGTTNGLQSLYGRAPMRLMETRSASRLRPLLTCPAWLLVMRSVSCSSAVLPAMGLQHGCEGPGLSMWLPPGPQWKHEAAWERPPGPDERCDARRGLCSRLPRAVCGPSRCTIAYATHLSPTVHHRYRHRGVQTWKGLDGGSGTLDLRAHAVAATGQHSGAAPAAHSTRLA